MPQMAPINWLFLFILFFFTYLIFNMMNYYIYTPKIKISKNKFIKINELNWKW